MLTFDLRATGLGNLKKTVGRVKSYSINVKCTGWSSCSKVVNETTTITNLTNILSVQFSYVCLYLLLNSSNTIVRVLMEFEDFCRKYTQSERRIRKGFFAVMKASLPGWR